MELKEKFITQVPLPTDYEHEIMTIAMEECAEVTQRLAKIKRFGAQDVQEGKTLNNIQRLSREVGDLICMFEMLLELELLDTNDLDMGVARKTANLKKYLQTTPEAAE